MNSLSQVLYKCKNQNFLITTAMVENFETHLSNNKNSPFLSSIGIMILSIFLFLSTIILSITMYIISVLMLLESLTMKIILLFSNTGIPGFNIQYIINWSVNNLKNMPKNIKLRKKQHIVEDDETVDPYYSEMPWGLDEVAKYSHGITSDEQLENIRKKI